MTVRTLLLTLLIVYFVGILFVCCTAVPWEGYWETHYTKNVVSVGMAPLWAPPVARVKRATGRTSVNLRVDGEVFALEILALTALVGILFAGASLVKFRQR